MKKLTLLLTILCIALTGMAQHYGDDKLPSGLDTDNEVENGDYIVLQKSGDAYVKAVLSETLKSYINDSILTDTVLIENLLTVNGESTFSDTLTVSELKVGEIFSIYANPKIAIADNSNITLAGDEVFSVMNDNLANDINADNSVFLNNSLKDSIHGDFTTMICNGKINTGGNDFDNSTLIGCSEIYSTYSPQNKHLIGVDSLYVQEFSETSKGFSGGATLPAFSGGVENQAIFGRYNSVSSHLFIIGNGTSEAARNNAFSVTASGIAISDAATYPGDTADITTGLSAGMVANDDNDDLMQYDGSEWQTFNKKCGDYIQSFYVPEDSSLLTKTTDAGTWYSIVTGNNSKFVNTASQGFSYDGDTLQFDNDGCSGDSVRFMLDYYGSARIDDNDKTVWYSVSVNDTIVEQSKQPVRCETAGELYPISGGAVFWLETDDKIRIEVKSDDAGGKVTTPTFSITLTRE